MPTNRPSDRHCIPPCPRPPTEPAAFSLVMARIKPRPWRASLESEIAMRRREFIRQTAAAAAGVAAGSYVAPANAQAHTDTLITLSESGTNSLDVMGIGTNRPGYESSWN